MYSDKLVVAVMANGKILRERKDEVFLPFGQEFTLRFKNLNSLRAVVRVSIDGQDATEGINGLIVPPNGTVDLERFIKNGNIGTGNRFKFIERTQKIEDGPRGIKAEDGLVRVEFEFEKQPAKIEDVIVNHHYNYRPWGWTYPLQHPRQYDVWHGPMYVSSSNVPLGTATTLTAAAGQGGVTSNSVKLSSAGIANVVNTSMNISGAALSTKSSDQVHDINSVQSFSSAVNDAGITVPGSLSDQKFEVGAWFPTDGQKHVMVLRLLGMVGEKVIQKPVTVKSKQRCSTCDHVNKATSRFCVDCGTALVLA